MAPKKFGMTKRESDARRASASVKRSLPKKSTWTPPKQPTMTTRKEGADVVATSKYGTKYKPQAPGASKSVLQRVDELGGGAADFVFPQKTAGKIVKRQPLDAEDYLALASLVPVPGVKAIGKGAQAVGKGAKALANPSPAYAATRATLPKAAGTTGISGLKAANNVAATAKTGVAAAGIDVGRSGKYISLAKKPSDVFTTPKPTKAMFTKDGVFDEAGFKAATTKFKKAKTTWENNAKEAEKFKQARSGADTSSRPASATTANPVAERLTPRQIAREKAAQARLEAAGGDIAAAGRQKGTPERAFQDKQRGQSRPLGEKTKDLMKSPEGSNPRQAPSMTPPERVTARASAKTRPPSRGRYKTQAGYDRAVKKWEESNTAALPQRSENVAESIVPPAPARRGGFKETGKRYRFEGKTGKNGQPKMTARPRGTAEADISEATIRENKQFQGIRPGKPIPEYRKIIDNLADAQPAQKARTPRGSKGGKAASAKPETPAVTSQQPAAKPATAKPEATAPEATSAKKPVAMRSQTKAGASKRKFGGGMKASTKPKPEVIKGEVVPSTKGPQAAPAAGTDVAVRPGSTVSRREYGTMRLPRNAGGQRAVGAAPRAIGGAPKAGTPAAAAAGKAKMSRLKKGLIAGGAIGATGVALKMTRDSDVSPNEAKDKAKAAGTPTEGFGTVKFGARNPKPGVYFDKYGRSIDKAEFNRRKVWWNEAKKMSKAEFEKAYAAEVARRKGYRESEGTKKFGEAATKASANKGVPVGVSEKKWASLTAAQKVKVRKAAKANPSGSAYQWVKSATK